MESPPDRGTVHSVAFFNYLAVEDVLFNVQNYLTVLEILNLSVTQKQIKTRCSKSYVWRSVAERLIITTQCDKLQIGEDYIEKMMEIFNISKPIHLYQAFMKWTIPLLGFWRRIPSDFASEYRGEFLIILVTYLTSTKKVVLGSSIDANGLELSHFSINIVNCYGLAQLVTISENSTTNHNLILIDNHSLVIRNSNESSERRYLRLPPPENAIPRNLSLNHPNIQTIQNCLGLVVASYGSHGLELLYISLQQRGETFSPEEHPLIDCDCILEGLKILGDRNVPAAQISFVIDISNSFDITASLAGDDRQVVSFPIGLGTRLIDLNQRRRHMIGWFRGYGQINYIQGDWNPEFVELSLIVYREPIYELGPAGILFSILWDDVDSAMRHMIDYSSYVHATIEYPSWNLAF